MNGLDKDTCMIVEDMLQEHVQNGNTVFLVSHTGIHNANHVKNYLIENGKIKNVESFEEISEG